MPGHDAAGYRSRDEAVLCKVGDAGVVAEEVLVEQQLAVDEAGRRGEDGEDGVGEDGGLAELVPLGRVGRGELLRGGRLDGLDEVSAALLLLSGRIRAPRPARR